MKNRWIKFGCFLTGYNYSILNASSEASAKSLKRYTSAMLIVCILWSFIGFVFSYRYLKAGIIGASFGAIIFCIIIIQIERQIILSTHKNNKLYVFRLLIAIVMAVIGSIIIDQIIFKEDIEQGKILTLENKVKLILPAKEAGLKSQISQLDTAITKKEFERKKLTDDIATHPTIKSFSSQSNMLPVPTTTRDSTQKIVTKVNLVRANSVSISSIPNPNIVLLKPLDLQIEELRSQKEKKDNLLLELRPKVEEEIKSKTGFLDELKIMFTIIGSSHVALFVWLLWMIFLTCIELFIMVSKWGEKPNDYDMTILHHMELQRKKLELMARAGGLTNL